jgi:hypothetical protein
MPGEGERYDRFFIRRELSRDADGAVFEAYDPQVRDLVALHLRDDGAGGLLVETHPLGGTPAAVPAPAEESADVAVPADRRRAAVLVALLAAVLVLVLAGALAVVRLVGGAAGPAADASAQAPSPSASEPAPVTSAPPAPPPPAPAFRCWDGLVRASAAECGTPNGPAGLTWAFPGTADEDCRPKSEDTTPGRRALVECLFRGGDAVVLLSSWSRPQAGVRYFSERQRLGQAVVADIPGGQALGWVGEVPEGFAYRAALLYTPYAFSVSVKARSAALRDRLIYGATLAPRPLDQWFGVPQ